MDSEFSINERFDFLDTYIKLVMLGKMNSLIITGGTGIGKSHTVMREIASYSEADASVTFVKGFSTARALYDTLYHNRNGIIVFDDCDSVVEDKIAINILKGALDSYDDRVISWLAKSNDKSIPNSFNFQGRIIFISNLPIESFDKAMKSRALTIDLKMTYDEKVDRMWYILKAIAPSADIGLKMQVLEYMTDSIEDEELVNLRTLEQAIVIAEASDGEAWKDQVRYMLNG